MYYTSTGWYYVHNRALILIVVVGNEGTENLGTILNPSGGTGQMFNPSVALGQGGLPSMMEAGEVCSTPRCYKVVTNTNLLN